MSSQKDNTSSQEVVAPMTAEQARAHFRFGGIECPYCEDSANFDCGSVKIEEGAAYQQCTCRNCGRTWTDSYHLAAVIDETGNILDAEPVGDVAKLADMVQRLSDFLAEAHADDKAANHHGDDGCSYCDVLAEASDLLAGIALPDRAWQVGMLLGALGDAETKASPRIIIEVTGGLVSGIASDVPLDRLNVSVLDFDSLNAMDSAPDESLNPSEREDRDELRGLRDEAEALPYNETV